MSKVLIIMDGGVIQGIFTDDTNLNIIVKDYDVQEDDRREQLPVSDDGYEYCAFRPGASVLTETQWQEADAGVDICDSL